MMDSTRSFAQQQVVREVHEMILHVFAQPSDELESVFKEQVREGSGDGAGIPQTASHAAF